MKRPAVFFDRDNTLIASDGYLGDPAKVVLISGAADAVARARALGYAVVIVSNQSGVARGMFSEEDVQAVNQRMEELLKAENPSAVIDRHEFCPFHPDGTIDVYARESDRRKPGPGMIISAARAMALDLERSWMIGDAGRDIEAGKAAGVRGILFQDPSLKRSPAAEKASSVEPDYTVSTLAEAMDFIEGKGGEGSGFGVKGSAEDGGEKSEVSSQKSVENGERTERGEEGGPEGVGEHATEERHQEREDAADQVEQHGGESDRSERPWVEAKRESVAAVGDSGLRMGHHSEPAALEAAGPAVTPAPIREVGPAHEQPSRGAGTASASSTSRSTPATTAREFAEVEVAPTKRVPKVAIGSKYVPPKGAADKPAPVRAAPVLDYTTSQPVTPSASEDFPPRSALAAKLAAREEEAPRPQPPVTGFDRMENLLEQIFLELRRGTEQSESDFSVSKLLAGIVQVIVLGVLFLAYFKRDAFETLQVYLMLAMTLQTLTVSLLIMSRQK